MGVTEFVKTITIRDIKFVLLWVLIGFSLHVLIKNKRGLKIIFKKPAESILYALITLIVFLQISFPSKVNVMAPKLLNFISTMAFSWFMTKYSVANEYEQKNKELAALSYQHSVGIKDKLEFTKREVENYMRDLKYCPHYEQITECKMKSKLENIKGQIIYAHQDAIDNINDWANAISEEIKIYDEITIVERKIEELENEKDELISMGENTSKIDKKLKKLNREKEELLLNIDPKIYRAIKVSKEGNELYDMSAIKEKLGKLTPRGSVNVKTSDNA